MKENSVAFLPTTGFFGGISVRKLLKTLVGKGGLNSDPLVPNRIQRSVNFAGGSPEGWLTQSPNSS